MQKLLEVYKILPAGDKRCRDVVDIVLNTEQQIVLVLLAEINLIEHLVRKTHALPVRKLAAGYYFALYICIGLSDYLENHKSIVDEYAVAD